MLNNLETFVAGILIEKLESYEGQESIGSSLASLLFEEFIQQGSYFCNKDESILWIKENFTEIGYVVDEVLKIDSEFLAYNNPFSSPEAFMVQIMVYVADYLLYDCKEIEDLYKSKILLTHEKVEAICDQLQALSWD